MPCRTRAAYALLAWLLTGCDAAPTEGPLVVHMLYGVGGRGDRDVNDAGYLGLLRGNRGDTVRVVQHTPLDEQDAVAALYQLFDQQAESDRELVIALTSVYEDAIERLDCGYGGRRLLYLDGTAKVHSDAPRQKCSELRASEYRTYAASFLGGVAAARLVPKASAVAIGGRFDQATRESAEGFCAGVEHAGGTCALQYIPDELDGFNNFEEGLRLAAEYYETRGVQVVFAAAGASNLGIAEAAKRAPGRYVVAADPRLLEVGKQVVIGAVAKRLDGAVRDAMGAMQTDSFEGGLYEASMDSGDTAFLINVAFEQEVGRAVAKARAEALDRELMYVEGL